MQHIHRLHPEWRHATAPTYIASYIFPLLLLAYEVYRLGSWIALQGTDFKNYSQTGYEFTMMLATFIVQVAAEGVFLAIAWVGRDPDLEQRLANVSLGVLCSFLVLAFDYLLQVAF
ncbi:hypothetical protein [Trinickia fusca]|uniref:Uncharacterized protein n=1 Tax=Trinickia fusca TaxID=2419777 RepID=A0A494X5L0_9BURK|nr:hypothetical protein [Trinickia fusca]RKP45975.1 hypothetical protein D7S89_18525 [Trinickia fusca]